MKVFQETEGLVKAGEDNSSTEERMRRIYEPGQFVFTDFTFETVPNTDPTVKIVSSFGKPRFTGVKLRSNSEIKRAVAGLVFGDPSLNIKNKLGFGNGVHMFSFYKDTYGHKIKNGNVDGKSSKVYGDYGIIFADTGFSDTEDLLTSGQVSSVSIRPQWIRGKGEISHQLSGQTCSSNPSFDDYDNTFATTLSYYDDEYRLVMTTKLERPRPASSSFSSKILY